MKTITLELSKRLAPYLEDVDTEYWLEIYTSDWEDINEAPEDFWNLYPIWNTRADTSVSYKQIKTLTLEEAIEFLPKKHPKYKEYYLRMMLYDKTWDVEYWMCEPCETMWGACWKTLLEAIEKMLEYLLDNDLLWKTSK